MSPDDLNTDDLNTDDLNTEEQIEAAFHDAVTQFTPPPGLKQTIRENVFPQATPERTKRMKIFKKYIPTAAAACIVAGIAAAVIFLTLGDGGASITWADVQQRIRNARTMTLKATIKKEGSPSREMKMMFKEPGLMRYEISDGSSKVVMILDARKNKRVVLMETGTQKRAFAYDETGLSAEFRQKKGAVSQNFLTQFKELIEESETELGEKEINGRTVKGYRVKKDNTVSTIWVDAKTAQPVEVNTTTPQGEIVEITMSDFEFDVELDDSLFNLDIPKGYTIRNKQPDLIVPSTEDLIEMLRVWTNIRDGTFPDILSPSNLMKDCKKIDDDKLKKMGLANAKKNLMKVSPSMTRAWTLLLTPHKGKSKYAGKGHYAGKGVKLGDAETAVFWYKPKDSETYKVIYGDLSVKDVVEKDLPEKSDKATGSE